MPAAPWQRLNPQLLRYVLAVSRGGSLSGAARQLKQLCQQARQSVQRDLWAGALRLGVRAR